MSAQPEIPALFDVTRRVFGPGIYDGLPLETYHASAGISSSGLKLIGRSPAHYAAEYIHGQRREPTPDMVLGSAAHALLDSESEFYRQFAVEPEGIDRRTNVGKAAWAAFTETANGRTVIQGDTHSQVKAMVESVLAHPKAAALFSNGVAERSVYWSDAKTRVLCKVRPDYWRADLDLIVDLKTVRDARPEPFRRQVINYGYDLSAAFYLDGTAATRFIWVAVEKTPPYAVACYLASPAFIERGRDQYQRYLDTYRECLAADLWPAYDAQITEIEPPLWALRESNL